MLFSFQQKILPLIFLKLNKFKLNRRLGVVYEFKKLKLERVKGFEFITRFNKPKLYNKFQENYIEGILKIIKLIEFIYLYDFHTSVYIHRYLNKNYPLYSLLQLLKYL